MRQAPFPSGKEKGVSVRLDANRRTQTTNVRSRDAGRGQRELVDGAEATGPPPWVRHRHPEGLRRWKQRPELLWGQILGLSSGSLLGVDAPAQGGCLHVHGPDSGSRSFVLVTGGHVPVGSSAFQHRRRLARTLAPPAPHPAVPLTPWPP